MSYHHYGYDFLVGLHVFGNRFCGHFKKTRRIDQHAAGSPGSRQNGGGGMDIKMLNEGDTQPRAKPGKRKAAYFALVVVIAAGVCAAYFGNRNEKTAPAYGTLSSTEPVSSDLQASGPASSKPVSQAASSSASSAGGTFRQSDDWQLLLVNAEIKLPDSFTPQIVSYDNVEMDKRIQPYFLQMKAAAAEDGVTLWLSGGYRSVEAQQQLFQQEVQSNVSQGLSQSKAEQKARKTVAEPGYSEHNTGLALDFNGSSSDFASTPAYTWMQKHAAEYGFILRYPQGKDSVTGIGFQPWFYRYVGKNNAEKMNAAGQCMEEYLKAS